MGLRIGVPAESDSGENRVAASPTSVQKMQKLGFSVCVEEGAGAKANFLDSDYRDAGAEIVGAGEAWQADLVVKVQPPTTAEIAQLKEGAHLVSFLWPAQSEDLIKALVAKKATALAMDCIPRISRAQKMDALSSMANIAGYKAVLEAANHFGSFFTGQMTAAGKVPPAKVLVIGAGVAGLSAIGTAKGLGAIVRAFDTRAAVKDQVKSMGAEFLELDFEESGEGSGGYAKVMSKEFIEAEMALFAEQAKDVDIIITTALIPGKKAPVLITTDMVKSMREGSVIVDLAAEQGGNCELTEHGKVVRKEGVSIIGYSDLPGRLPTQSSALYANNITHLLSDMVDKESKEYGVDLEDEVVRGALIVHGGEVTWPPPQPKPAPEPKKPAAAPQEPVAPAEAATPKDRMPAIMIGLAIVFGLLGAVAPEGFLSHLTVFVLACIIGWQVVWNVNPALHTPLMSVTNAISGIIVLGAMVQMNSDFGQTSTILAAVAVLIATINIAGGFLVTQRMLSMFRK